MILNPLARHWPHKSTERRGRKQGGTGDFVMNNFAHSPRPSCSPWGAIQQADQLIPGAWLVSTATHGGILLSDERQAAMPDALRMTEPAYEEACDWSLPILAFQDEFAASPSCRPSWITLARDIARCWHPDRFTAHTGEAVAENPSQADLPTSSSSANSASPARGAAGQNGCLTAKSASLRARSPPSTISDTHRTTTKSATRSSPRIATIPAKG